MKSISNFRDLEEYGIVYLTGESCHQMLRILCDLTQQGKDIVEKAFGFKINSENWNTGSKDNPHVASIMLAPHSIPQIAVYCLLPEFAWVGISNDNAVFGVNSDKELQDYKDMCERRGYKVLRQFKGKTYTRNQHQMSGRID